MKKTIKILVVGVLAAGGINLAVASHARVESMGKRATFFMDDISVFDNAANINVFPNFLVGGFGTYVPSKADVDAKQRASDLQDRNIIEPRFNRDPEDPWFGGIFSYSFDKREEGSLYPQISIGGAFNRKDQLLYSLIPDSVIDNAGSVIVVPDPITNFDGFLGFTFRNGGMIGGHTYIAIQEGANVVNGQVLGSPDASIGSKIIKGDLGFNWPLARNIDGELSFAWYMIQFGPESINPQYSFSVKARSFSTFELINGELVPILNYSQMNAPGIGMHNLDAGIGVNASLDRGFFWLGLEAVFSKTEKKGYSQDGASGPQIYSVLSNEKEKDILRGGRISFGIERNIWWDWLVVRVGGSKLIASVEQNNSNYFIYSNPESNGMPDDHIGWGLGLNIEEKLKVDATLADDFLYTFGNLISGPQHHVFTRISATYSF